MVGREDDAEGIDLRTLRHLLDRAAPRQQQLPFLDEHTLIRPLSDYQQFVHDTFQKEAAR